jgi:AraC-like DNA-binding protein
MSRLVDLSSGAQWLIETKPPSMTPRANSLTDRDTSQVGSIAAAFSMPANDVRALMNAFGSCGYDVASLLRSAGLSDAELSNPDVRISCEKLGQIITSAQRTRFTPNLALHLAHATPLGAYPLLDYVVLTSETVGAGVRGLARYFRLVGNPIAIEVDEDSDPIRIDLAGGAAAFNVEFVTSLMQLHLRQETDDTFSFSGVSFRHKPDDVVAFERALGCRVRSLAPVNSINVTSDVWRLRLRRRDPLLHRILETHADDVLARTPEREGLALDVQRALTSHLAGGDTRLGVVARQLALSPRTLQRRLTGEGVSYRQLLEHARKEAAGRYIGESTLAICEVAFLVGYSEPGPFHRAFKRWFGITPETFRAKAR